MIEGVKIWRIYSNLKEDDCKDFAKINETRNSVLCSEIFSKKNTILGIEITFLYFKH